MPHVVPLAPQVVRLVVPVLPMAVQPGLMEIRPPGLRHPREAGKSWSAIGPLANPHIEIPQPEGAPDIPCGLLYYSSYGSPSSSTVSGEAAGAGGRFAVAVGMEPCCAVALVGGGTALVGGGEGVATDASLS